MTKIETYQAFPSILARIILYGKPKPSKLAKNKWGSIYNPLTPYIFMRKWEVKSQFREKPYSDPVKIDYFFCFAIPKNWTKEQKEKALKGGVKHAKRPDADNLLKTYNDIIKNIVITDDAQITTGVVKKEYGEHPGIEMVVYYDS